MSQSTSPVLNNNVLAFIGLSNEFCETLEQVRQFESPTQLVDAMVRLLPRIYISATDLRIDVMEEREGYVDSVLEEEYYDSIRRSIEALLGEDDAYLEVFEEDMKYSDTPVSASIAEGLCDIFQVLYNFISTIRSGDITDDAMADAVTSVKEDFDNYWSATLCNVLRAVNHLAHT